MSIAMAQSAVDRRRHSRAGRSEAAALVIGRWPFYQTFTCRIRDMSDSGASIEFKEMPLMDGQTVILRFRSADIPEIPLAGRIIRSEHPTVYGLHFTSTIPEQLEHHQIRSRKAIAGLGIFCLAVAICALKWKNLYAFWYTPFLETYSLLAAAFVLSRAVLSLIYREPRDCGYQPTVSVVIAAKNESKHIAETIHHCFRSSYPADRMEVIAIDDGSTDDTWQSMVALQEQYPALKLFRFEKNMGKRHGMAWGAQHATGEILVYVDSDSYVDVEAIYRIVQPFVEPSIGAVSGHILAVEEENNFISKMEAARYYVSHRLMKAAESVFGAVTCCPGAFSAYRRSAVLRILPQWMNQTFLGSRATFGDDRSLTNFILRTHKVIYHAGARCLTYVPDNWPQFFKQQLRWKKSWARETTVAARQMYRQHPIAALSYYTSILLTLFSPIMVLHMLTFIPSIGAGSILPYLAGLFLTYSFLCLFYCYHTQSKNWYFGLAFAGLYLGFLCFQNYYAILTVRRNHWGTR